MANTDTATHLPPLGTHVREEAGNELQATLVELLDLSLVGKQLHWSLVGPLFQPLHERLDVMVDAWRELYDTVAERSVAIGAFPDGQADAIVGSADRATLEPGPIADTAVVRELTHRLAAACEAIRGRMDRLGELDLASQDVLVEVVRELEKELWMIRAQFSTNA